MVTDHVAGWKAQTEYCGEFTHQGNKWCLNIFAVDDADAMVKAQSVRDTFVILGCLDCVIEVPL